MSKPYRSVADELCTTDQSILLCGNRIVLPTNLREQAIMLAHEDHAGMTRCKQRLRAKLWWPHMDKEKATSNPAIHARQQPNLRDQNQCSLHSFPAINGLNSPLTSVAPSQQENMSQSLRIIILAGPLLRSSSQSHQMNWLNALFAEHGYPEEIKMDNALYFTSAQFKETRASWGVKAKTVTEYWPQANGQVERFNEALEKHIQTAIIEGKDWRTTLPTMLLNYLTTPHRMTSETPAKLLMQRELQTKLPSVPTQKTVADPIVRAKDAKEKVKAKAYADRKRHAFKRNLKIGDFVLVTQRHTNKYSTKFHRNPMKIVKIHGTQIIIKGGQGKQYRRNTSHVKLFV